MANPKKIIVTSKKNLQAKYGNNFQVIDNLLTDLVAADKKRRLDTQIVFIDDQASAEQAGTTAVTSITRQSCKRAIDNIYKIHVPAYLVIFGSQDVIPFQELANTVPYDPRKDADQIVPSDLPYACDAPYSTKISSFTGPSRVVGRIPDITGKDDVEHVKKVIGAYINYKPLDAENFQNYFSVTANVWRRSTQQSLSSIFGNNTNLKACPPTTISYPNADVEPLVHFYNCHGAPTDSKFYGQEGDDYPTAMESTDLVGKIKLGTVVASECCYGAELYDPLNEGMNQLGIANTYLENGAIAFVGSSTISYGPAGGQALADLITQYYIKNVLAGASSGRALLDARQSFLSVCTPMDPYELKTLAQFYLLGDPSMQVVIEEPSDAGAGEDTIENRRMRLMKKGADLAASVETSEMVEAPQMKEKAFVSVPLSKVYNDTGFKGDEQEFLFQINTENRKVDTFAKALTGTKKITFRVLIHDSKEAVKNVNLFEVLVLKEAGDTLLGWRVYHRK